MDVGKLNISFLIVIYRMNGRSKMRRFEEKQEPVSLDTNLSLEWEFD